MGVNDLIKSWKTGEISGEKNSFKEGYDAAMDRCGNQLEIVADLCWHPVSEPPTEADGDDSLHVLVMVRWRNGDVTAEEWGDVASGQYEGMTHWARIRDVVLLPSEEQE